MKKRGKWLIGLALMLVMSIAAVACDNTPEPAPTVKPAISGPTVMTLPEGYAATFTGEYTVTGDNVTVTKTAGSDKIVWNDGQKRLDIAAGLDADGSPYAVTLKASNGNAADDAQLTFTLTVTRPAAQTYTITYDPGQYGAGEIAPGQKIEGEAYTLSSDTFTRSGFRQDGWSTTDGGDKVYGLGGSYQTDADVTLYPHWVETYYTVRLPAGEGYTLTDAEGEPFDGDPSVREGEDFTFKVELDAGYDQSVITVRAAEVILQADDGVYTVANITADVTVTVMGVVVNTYTITYDPGEYGNGAIDAGVKTHGAVYTLSGDTFTRSGYTQEGWAITDGGEKAYDAGEPYTENASVTLYPFWVAEYFQIELPAGDGFTVTDTADQTISDAPRVQTGDDFAFKVVCDANKTVVVKANGVRLTGAADVYTIESITADQTVTVEVFTLVSTIADFRDIHNDLSGNYILMNDIDFTGYDYADNADRAAADTCDSETPGKKPCYGDGSSDAPYVYPRTLIPGAFTGIFDGNGYALKNLSATQQNSGWSVAVFEIIGRGGIVRNTGFLQMKINGNPGDTPIWSAAVAKQIDGGTIRDCYIQVEFLKSAYTGYSCAGIVYEAVNSTDYTSIIENCIVDIVTPNNDSTPDCTASVIGWVNGNPVAVNHVYIRAASGIAENISTANDSLQFNGGGQYDTLSALWAAACADEDFTVSGVWNLSGEEPALVTGVMADFDYRVELDKTSLVLGEGQSSALVATVYDALTGGASVDDAAIVWQSSDPAVVAVTDGALTAGTMGRATVTARYGARTAICTVDVFKKVSTIADLRKIHDNLAANYILVNDIDFTGYNYTDNTDYGFETFVRALIPGTFTGIFDGNGYALKSLHGTQVDSSYPVTVFENIGACGVVRNTEFIDFEIASGRSDTPYQGGAIARTVISSATIRDCYVQVEYLGTAEIVDSECAGLFYKVNMSEQDAYKTPVFIENCIVDITTPNDDSAQDKMAALLYIENGEPTAVNHVYVRSADAIGKVCTQHGNTVTYTGGGQNADMATLLAGVRADESFTASGIWDLSGTVPALINNCNG